jgi:hypothetical protein
MRVLLQIILAGFDNVVARFVEQSVELAFQRRSIINPDLSAGLLVLRELGFLGMDLTFDAPFEDDGIPSTF